MLRLRYSRIVLFFARIIITIIFWDLVLPRLGFRGLTRRSRPRRMQKFAASFRSLAVRMGGVMIKVGQFLSARVDVLPVEITDELAGLQDEVPPESFRDIRRVAEAEYGVGLLEKFLEFDPEPLAAASLGQVHRARLRQPYSGEDEPTGSPDADLERAFVDVVVKVQRPDIEKLIATDLSALRTVGRWLRRYPPIRRRADVPALLGEFSRILYQEIDYLAEGRNAETFANNFSDSPGVRVPMVVWTHTTRRALTLENVLSIKITDYQAITAAGISRQDVAARLLDTYLKQIFEDAFFHADPHPGNLFVHPLIPGELSWELVFVDFGMVGRLPENLLSGLRELLVGVGTRDASRVVKAYQMMDILLPGADLERLEQAESLVFDRFWGKNMAELTSVPFEEMREFAAEFRDLIYELPFQVPQNMIFLGRCVGILSGMCTGLDPQFNLWEHLLPFARKLVAQEAPQGLEFWFGELEGLARAFWTVPRRMDDVLSKMERGQLAVRAPEISNQVSRLERALVQLAGSVTFTALLLGGIQLYLGDQALLGGVLMTGAGLNLVWLFLSSSRRRRRW